MNSLANLSAQQLRRAAGIKDKINSLQNELNRIFGATQKARWAKAKGNVSKAQPAKGKRKMSAAAKKKISVAAKARWAKIKAVKKK